MPCAQTLNSTQFQAVLASAGLSWLNVPGIFDLFDSDSSNGVNYFELLIGLFAFHCDIITDSSDVHITANDRELALFYFEIFDVMGDGSISREEMLWVLAQFFVDNKPCDKLFQKDLFERFDVDGNGRIDREEFVCFFCHLSAVASTGGVL